VIVVGIPRRVVESPLVDLGERPPVDAD